MIRYLIDKLFIKQPRFRRAVTSMLYRNRDTDITLCGTLLHINSRRENGYLRATKTASWNGTIRDEMPVLMNLMALVRDGDLFVDAGANVGLFTHTMSRLRAIYPHFSIVAFEPHPSTFQRLSFHKPSCVTFHNLGLGARRETLEFVDGAVSHVFTQKDKANSYNIPSETIQVAITRLDEVELPPGAIILKIDVEGQEKAVIEGARKLIEAGRVKAVYCDGYEDPEIHTLLEAAGFELRCGRTFKPVSEHVFSLLAIHRRWLESETSQGQLASVSAGS